MQTTKEQRAALQHKWDMAAADWIDEEGRSADGQFFAAFFEAWPALLADAERAERMEKVLRNILGSWGTIQLADAVIEARAALGEAT